MNDGRVFDPASGAFYITSFSHCRRVAGMHQHTVGIGRALARRECIISGSSVSTTGRSLGNVIRPGCDAHIKGHKSFVIFLTTIKALKWIAFTRTITYTRKSRPCSLIEYHRTTISGFLICTASISIFVWGCMWL